MLNKFTTSNKSLGFSAPSRPISATRLPNASMAHQIALSKSISLAKSLADTLRKHWHPHDTVSARRGTVEVNAGEMRTVTGDEALAAHHLMSSSALVFLTGYDPTLDVYRQRTMIHLNGGLLNAPLRLQSGYRDITGFQAITNLINRRQGFRHKLIMGFGVLNSSPTSRAITMVQGWNRTIHGQPPLLALIDLCGPDNYRFQIEAPSLIVRPDGSLVLDIDRPGQRSHRADIPAELKRYQELSQ